MSQNPSKPRNPGADEDRSGTGTGAPTAGQEKRNQAEAAADEAARSQKSGTTGNVGGEPNPNETPEQKQAREKQEQDDREKVDRQAQEDAKPKSVEDRLSALEHEIGVMKNSPPRFGVGGGIGDQTPIAVDHTALMADLTERIGRLEGRPKPLGG